MGSAYRRARPGSALDRRGAALSGPVPSEAPCRRSSSTDGVLLVPRVRFRVISSAALVYFDAYVIKEGWLLSVPVGV